MDIVDAVERRKSIRAFRPDPVPKDVLREIIELSLRAPSWANTQPWEFAVATGQKLEAIKTAFAAQQGVKATPDFPGPEEFPEPFHSRFVTLTVGLSGAAGTAGQNDVESAWFMQGPRLYGAPVAIYVYVERSLCYQTSGFNVWPVFDCGLICQNIMLLALKYGLGTIAQAQAVHYPGILRRALELPETKLMLLGIAIGYPDMEKAINGFTSERESVDKVIRWHGFDHSE